MLSLLRVVVFACFHFYGVVLQNNLEGFLFHGVVSLLGDGFAKAFPSGCLIFCRSFCEITPESGFTSRQWFHKMSPLGSFASRNGFMKSAL